MCGIAGFILDEINPQAADWLTVMTQRLYHRGPDDGGAVVFGMNGDPVVQRQLERRDKTVDWSYVPVKLGLGARRLAVVDRSAAGHQPMSSDDGRVWLVYNGEIYNHAVLRSELQQRGMHFQGHCDTEVLMAAYRAWGCECFGRLEGMWAAVIVDWAAGRMVLSRDRFGIKPLYVSRFNAGMAFASEIKSLLVLPGALQGVNEARLRDFLCGGRVDHTDDTLFENIWAAPTGCWIELDLRGRGAMHAGGSVHRYWRPQYEWTDVSDAAQRVKRSLSESVTAHLQGDVPIGSCLSGGLDSSAIVSLAQRQRSERAENSFHLTQHTFTASLPNSELDETGYAKTVVETFPDLQHHLIEPTPQRLINDIDTLMWHQEQPFGSPSIYMQWEVMRLAREVDVTVLLDGQGGDELFCGYEGYIPAYLAHLLRRGRLSAFWREYHAAKRSHFRNGHLLKHTAAAMLTEARRSQWRFRSYMRQQPWLIRDLFSADELPGMCRVLELKPADDISGTWRTPVLASHLWTVLLRESLPSLLRFEDRNSMAFSIEARVPFLARDVVELAMRLPTGEKIDNGELKVVLRKALCDIAPNAVLERRDKIGFTAPTSEWMRGGLRDWWQEALTSKSFLDRGCFAPKGVLQVLQRFDAGDDSVADDLWRMAIVEHWARQFLDTA